MCIRDRDESHTAQQAALSGVNRAQQEAERLTILNLDKVTKKSEAYIDSMVQLAKRRIERLADVYKRQPSTRPKRRETVLLPRSLRMAHGMRATTVRRSLRNI